MDSLTFTPAFTPDAKMLVSYAILKQRAEIGKKITYQELYELMAGPCGWPAYQQGNAWYKRLPLPEVALLCKKNGEPCLSALVRNSKDGYVGWGYHTAHEERYGVTLCSHDYNCPCGGCISKIRQAGKQEMLKCYNHFQREGN